MIEEAVLKILQDVVNRDEWPLPGTLVYPVVAPDRRADNYITYQQISGSEPDLPESPESSRWQINIVSLKGSAAPNYRSGKTAAQLVRIGMTATVGIVSEVCIAQIRFESQNDLHSQDTDTFAVAQDFIIKHA